MKKLQPTTKQLLNDNGFGVEQLSSMGMRKWKLLELFGGIGTPRKALENLNIDIKSIDYVEFWHWAKEGYSNLFPHFYQTQNVLDWNLFVDVLVHGSPCQDFSTAGKNDLSTGRSILYMRTLEIIGKELNPRPKFVIWENVKGLLNKKNKPHFDHYLKTMEEYGYKNYYQVLNSKEFGIPQSRNRIFVVSVRSDINFKFNFDNLVKNDLKPLKTFLDNKVDKSYYLTQNSMIKAVQSGKIKIIDNVVETITTKQWRWNNAGVVKISLHEKDFNSTDFIHNVDKSLIHTIGTNKANNRIAEEIIGEPIEGVPIFFIDDKPYHLRILTERECWRLMGWKDIDIDKVIHLPKSHLYHMAGNAIVVQVMEAIFKQIMEAYEIWK